MRTILSGCRWDRTHKGKKKKKKKKKKYDIEAYRKM